MFNLRQRCPLTALLVAAAAPLLLSGAQAQGSGEVVYDNTRNSKPQSPQFTTREYGDEISLAGTARIVTSFVFEYFGNITPGNSPTAAAVIRFYENNGSLFDGKYPRPGSLLWESDPLPLLKNLVPTDGNFNLATIPVPNITVTDTLTWTVQFSGLTGGNSAVLTISDPVSVGKSLPAGGGGFVLGSYNDYWEKADPFNADSWALKSAGGTDFNFYAKITAIPEPQTYALLLVGAAALCFVRRQSRR
jgi:hypothetical protein